MKHIILGLALLTGLTASAQWTTSTTVDEMSGETSGFASSTKTRPSKAMAFPYSDTRSWVGVGTDNSDTWVYLGFSNSPNLTNTDAQSGGYSTFTARVKFDDGAVRDYSMTQDWGAKFLHFRADSRILAEIKAGNTMLVELKWHGSGAVVFKYSLSGSSTALNKIGA